MLEITRSLLVLRVTLGSGMLLTVYFEVSNVDYVSGVLLEETVDQFSYTYTGAVCTWYA